MACLATGVAGTAASQPVLGAVAGTIGLACGLLGWRRAQSSAAGHLSAAATLDGLRVAELSEELSLARLREQALNQRIELLENAARAAASSAAGLHRDPLGPSRQAPTKPRDGADDDGGAERDGDPGERSGTGDADGDGDGDGHERDDQHLLTDAETGLFSEAYFDVALEARIAAARRRLRPVALVLLDVVRGLATESSEADADLVTRALRRTLREADTACRLADGRYALVLEDTPENGAIWTVERVRTHLAESGTIHTVWAGVACYPAHAFDRDEILRQAEEALRQAREWRQDRIEVATAE